MSVFRRLFGGGNASRHDPAPRHQPFTAEVSPEARFYVVGDVHGEADALEALLSEINAEDPGAPIIFVGDYVDRGERSADVLRRVMALNTANPARRICLRGNHEQMMLDFLEAPEARGDRWLRHGGLQTLASFGVMRPPGTQPGDLRDRLADAMGSDLIDWMQALPLRWQSGNVAVVHAAADPTLPIERQSPKTLLWGHPSFLRANRADGIWVVHGHTIVDAAIAQDGRVSVDTGAYATGRLSAACIEPGGVRFLSN